MRCREGSGDRLLDSKEHGGVTVLLPGVDFIA